MIRYVNIIVPYLLTDNTAVSPSLPFLPSSIMSKTPVAIVVP